MANWAANESGKPAMAAGVGTDVLRGGALSTRSASSGESPWHAILAPSNRVHGGSWQL